MKGAKAYGHALLYLLFTKHEQKISVVVRSRKTAKPHLDPTWVEVFGKIVPLCLSFIYYFLRMHISQIWQLL